MAEVTYTTIGSVRGSCGHNHRSPEAAGTCIARDQRGCETQGGYSDREVRRSDGRELMEWEQDAVAQGKVLYQ